MNIFDEYSQLQELMALKTIVPEFAKSAPEPFVRSAQQDVEPPVWNKVKLDQSIGSNQNVQTAPSPNVTFIAGVQNAGGQFEIKIVSVNGLVNDPPT